ADLLTVFHRIVTPAGVIPSAPQDGCRTAHDNDLLQPDDEVPAIGPRSLPNGPTRTVRRTSGCVKRYSTRNIKAFLASGDAGSARTGATSGRRAEPPGGPGPAARRDGGHAAAGRRRRSGAKTGVDSCVWLG